MVSIRQGREREGQGTHAGCQHCKLSIARFSRPENLKMQILQLLGGKWKRAAGRGQGLEAGHAGQGRAGQGQGRAGQGGGQGKGHRGAAGQGGDRAGQGKMESWQLLEEREGEDRQQGRDRG